MENFHACNMFCTLLQNHLEGHWECGGVFELLEHLSRLAAFRKVVCFSFIVVKPPFFCFFPDVYRKLWCRIGSGHLQQVLSCDVRG
jgi:hypothetical protein